MANPVLERTLESAAELRNEGLEADKLGKLPDTSVKRMKEIGAIRMLQPRQYGGLEAGPRAFAESVMATASLSPAAGWVQGIVGVHPWQLALGDPRLMEEIWGEDQDTWVASPYMPNGVARRVDGGYVMSGRWSFSSGTDHCQWAFLGAMAHSEDGTMEMPPRMLHVVLPRADYRIIEDSWDVVGLRGTGSKDLVVEEAFIPDYRVQEYDHLLDGTQVRMFDVEQTLYRMPWSCVFPLGITSATIGICEGLLASAHDYQRDRIGAQGEAIKDDPYVLYQLGESASEVNAARKALIANAEEMWDIVDRGEEPSFARRAEGRRTQVAAAWQAVRAIDNVYARCGGTALRMDRPMQRFWRDAHAGLHHAIHVPSTVYHASALSDLGVEAQGPLRAMI